jgi:hypothetical protein
MITGFFYILYDIIYNHQRPPPKKIENSKALKQLPSLEFEQQKLSPPLRYHKISQ